MTLIVDTGTARREEFDHTLTQAIYNSLDACVCRELLPPFLEQLSHKPEAKLIYDFELGLRAPALEMMVRGLRVDPNERKRMIRKCEKQIALLKEILNAIIRAGLGWKEDPKGWCLNPVSPSKLKFFFYGVLGLPEHHKFDKGERKVTTNREAIEKIRDSSEGLVAYICEILLTIRDLGKTVGTLRWKVEKDGRMRFSFSPTGTSTGRWSSSKNIYRRAGNSQQITNRIRRIFVADPGRKFAYCDLRSAESTAVAYLAGDEAYIEANTSSLKVHTRVAQMVWPDLPWPSDPHKATKLAKEKFYREFSRYHLSKIGSHSGNYGALPETQARHLHVPPKVMRDFQRQYFAAFSGILGWQDDTAREIQLTSCLTTPVGRRRRFFGRVTDKSVIREALAYVPQSLIGDLLNLALYRVWKLLWPRVRVMSQLHDAILIDYAEEDETLLLPQVLEMMEVAVRIKSRTMVIRADAATGWNWGEEDKENPDGLKDYKDHDSRVRIIPALIPMEDLLL